MRENEFRRRSESGHGGSFRRWLGALFSFLIFTKVQLLYNVVLVSAVCIVYQLCVYIYPFFSGFPSHSGHHRAPSRVHCATQQVLISHSINSVYVSNHISQFMPSLSFPLVSICLFLHLCLYFCFVHKMVHTICFQIPHICVNIPYVFFSF